MTISKLVEINGRYGGWLEIDPVKTKRVATEFKNWLLTLDANNDPFSFLKYDLPLVESALTKEMELPYKGNIPHTRDLGEGLLPREYIKFAAPFYNTITGTLYKPTAVIQKGDKFYALAEFEQPQNSE